MHLNAPGFPEALHAWLDATDPDKLPEWAIGDALYVHAPAIEVITTCMKDATPADFDRALTKALVCHWKFWDGQDNISGMLALPALALAGCRLDMGYRTTVRSDYLPMSVVDPWTPGMGAWAAERGQPWRSQERRPG